jgi:hypothetical protein
MANGIYKITEDFEKTHQIIGKFESVLKTRKK